MSAVANAPLTPTLSPVPGAREPVFSLSRSRERAGVRVGVLIALVAICILAPLLNLAVPTTSAFHLSDYAVALIAKS